MKFVHVNNFSIFCFKLCICGFNCEPSLTVILALITGRVTPQARPRACLLRTNTYGTFLSSHNNGRCIKISIGVVSAAMTERESFDGDDLAIRMTRTNQFRFSTVESFCCFIGTLAQLSLGR